MHQRPTLMSVVDSVDSAPSPCCSKDTSKTLSSSASAACLIWCAFSICLRSLSTTFRLSRSVTCSQSLSQHSTVEVKLAALCQQGSTLTLSSSLRLSSAVYSGSWRPFSSASSSLELLEGRSRPSR